MQWICDNNACSTDRDSFHPVSNKCDGNNGFTTFSTLAITAEFFLQHSKTELLFSEKLSNAVVFSLACNFHISQNAGLFVDNLFVCLVI